MNQEHHPHVVGLIKVTLKWKAAGWRSAGNLPTTRAFVLFTWVTHTSTVLPVTDAQTGNRGDLETDTSVERLHFKMKKRTEDRTSLHRFKPTNLFLLEVFFPRLLFNVQMLL